MSESNLELFKKALDEAVEQKFDEMANSCTEEITPSQEHQQAMQRILCDDIMTERDLRKYALVGLLIQIDREKETLKRQTKQEDIERTQREIKKYESHYTEVLNYLLNDEAPI